MQTGPIGSAIPDCHRYRFRQRRLARGQERPSVVPGQPGIASHQARQSCRIGPVDDLFCQRFDPRNRRRDGWSIWGNLACGTWGTAAAKGGCPCTESGSDSKAAVEHHTYGSEDNGHSHRDSRRTGTFQSDCITACASPCARTPVPSLILPCEVSSTFASGSPPLISGRPHDGLHRVGKIDFGSGWKVAQS